MMLLSGLPDHVHLLDVLHKRALFEYPILGVALFEQTLECVLCVCVCVCLIGYRGSGLYDVVRFKFAKEYPLLFLCTNAQGDALESAVPFVQQL